MEQGSFIQKIHGPNGTIIIDENVEIQRDEFIEMANGCKNSKEWSIVRFLDGTISLRWKELVCIVTVFYTPNK